MTILWDNYSFKNVSPFNIFGLHDMICGCGHFPSAKGEVLLAAFETLWHHCEETEKDVYKRNK